MKPTPAARRPSEASPRSALASNFTEQAWFGGVDTVLPRRAALRSAEGTAVCEGRIAPLPEVAAEVNGLLSGRRDPVRPLGRLVAVDPALAAVVLRHANRAAGDGTGTISTIGAALARVGPRVLPGLLSTHVSRMAERDASDLERRLHVHCAGVGAIARELAHLGRLPYTSELYACGLLHEFGWIALAQAGRLGADRATLADLHRLGADPIQRASALQAIGLSSGAAASWGIAPASVRSIGWLRMPARAIVAGGTLALMVCWLSIADDLESLLAEEPSDPRERLEGMPTSPCWRYVGLEQPELLHAWPRLVQARRHVLAHRPLPRG